MPKKFIDFRQEISDYSRFLKTENNYRNIVFYSEDITYYAYFEGLIDHLTKVKDQKVSYITSNNKDPLFETSNKNLKVFYINKLLSLFIRLCKAKVLIMIVQSKSPYYDNARPRNVSYQAILLSCPPCIYISLTGQHTYGLSGRCL
jgi:hypothetical protein